MQGDGQILPTALIFPIPLESNTKITHLISSVVSNTFQDIFHSIPSANTFDMHV